MNEGDTLRDEELNQSDSFTDETEEVNEPGSQDTNEVSAAEQSDADPENQVSEQEETPSSTVIQVVHDSDNPEDYTINELDVSGLNAFIQAQNEVRSVTPTSNDYYSFISGDIEEYFSGLMAQYPLNDYKAVHLKHYVSSGSYTSYYDDYYYLWYDYPSTDCVEVYKANNSSQYRVTWTTQNDLNATIVYGSSQGQSDLRKGVSYVQEMGLLFAVCVCLVLYICHAVFKHLVR